MKEMKREQSPLLGSLRYPNLPYVQKLLSQGHYDPNEIDAETGLNGLQLAIEYGGNQSEALIHELLKDDIRKKTDINLVGRNFVLPLSMVVSSSKIPSQAKIQIMSLLIAKRRRFSQEVFKKYLYICIERANNHFNRDDFALLAHYLNRLCGCTVSDILMHDHNADRYMVHLCQYSYAEKDEVALEGWHADEFLPLRIFSLFEILVKIKKGIISIPETKKIEWASFIENEILDEIETLRTEQERQAIVEVYEKEPQPNVGGLYSCLAESLVRKLLSGSPEEYVLASGYRGHTIYIAFSYIHKHDELVIRYDNLGSGTEKPDPKNPKNKIPRHPELDGKWQPRVVRVRKISDNRQKLVSYIKALLEVKNEALPPREEEGNRERQKQLKLEAIYDDNNMLGHEVTPLDSSVGMDAQQAQTCVTTSHQVGLLQRCNDQEFYEWLVAEEKRCIVQSQRNAGAILGSTETRFWNYDKDAYKQPLFWLYCPLEPFQVFMNGLESMMQRCIEADKTGNLRPIFENCQINISTKNITELDKNLDDLVENPQLALKNPVFFDLVTIYVRCALSFYQETDLNLFLFIGKTKDKLAQVRQAEQFKHLPETEYCLALLCYKLRLNKECEQHLRNYESGVLASGDDALHRTVFNVVVNPNKPTVRDRIIFSQICAGYLKLEDGNITSAKKYFESTGKNFLREVGGIFSLGSSTPDIYSSFALLGLGICCLKHVETCDDNEQARILLSQAVNYFSRVNTDSSAPHAIGIAAVQYLHKINSLDLMSRIQSERADGLQGEAKKLKPNN